MGNPPIWRTVCRTGRRFWKLPAASSSPWSSRMEDHRRRRGLRSSRPHGQLGQPDEQYSGQDTRLGIHSESRFFFAARDKPRHTMKKGRKHACQTSVDTHPNRAPKGQDRRSGSRSSPLSIQPAPTRSNRPPSLQTVREPKAQEPTFTLGCRGFPSSTRVGSVALLGNQDGDKYYRKDSPAGEESAKGQREMARAFRRAGCW